MAISPVTLQLMITSMQKAKRALGMCSTGLLIGRLNPLRAWDLYETCVFSVLLFHKKSRNKAIGFLNAGFYPKTRTSYSKLATS